MDTGHSEAGCNAQPRGGASKKNARLAVALTFFAVGMIGLSFAAVPLYRIFCERTGYAGTPQRAAAASTSVSDKTVRVRFDANVSPGLKWSFAPVERQITVHIGENKIALFRVSNLSNETLTGAATFNVTPLIMGAYFTKVQCFCFTEQTLKPGETVDMPVSFYVDPGVLKDPDAAGIQDITLSYTFFRAHKTADTSFSPSWTAGSSDTGAAAGQSGRTAQDRS